MVKKRNLYIKKRNLYRKRRDLECWIFLFNHWCRRRENQKVHTMARKKRQSKKLPIVRLESSCHVGNPGRSGARGRGGGHYFMCPQQESNLQLSLRTGRLYPFNYEDNGCTIPYVRS